MHFIYENIFEKTVNLFSKTCFYISRGIIFQDIPPKNGNSVAINEDVFFIALRFGCSQGY